MAIEEECDLTGDFTEEITQSDYVPEENPAEPRPLSREHPDFDEGLNPTPASIRRFAKAMYLQNFHIPSVLNYSESECGRPRLLF